MLRRRIITTARNFSRAALMNSIETTPPPPSSDAGDGGRQRTLSGKILKSVKGKADAVAEIKKWKDSGKSLRKYELQRIVRELRRVKRYKTALEVCEWMRTQEDIKLFAGDYALQLDLIAKLHGVEDAEQFFIDIPAKMRSGPTYSSLLHTYVKNRDYDKAEALKKKMSKCGLLTYPLPYNRMMAMYLENGKLEKIPELINELKTKTTPDVVSYNMWLTMCQTRNDLETAENVFCEMKAANLEPDWITYSILTSLYTKNKQFDKAQSTLTAMEVRVSQKQHRYSYTSLISLHADLGNNDGVLRIWKQMKLLYGKLRDTDYRCMIKSLLLLGEQKSAEKVYDEWEAISPMGDVRVPNLLIEDYIINKQVEKAKTLLHRLVDKGIKPSYTTWEMLTWGYLESKLTYRALEYFEKAICSVQKWEPNLRLVRKMYLILEEEQDIHGAENLLTLLRKAGFVNTEIYNCLLRVYVKAEKMPSILEERMVKDSVLPDSETKELIRVTSKMCTVDDIPAL